MKLTLRTCCLVLITLLLASYAGMGLGILPGVPFPMKATSGVMAVGHAPETQPESPPSLSLGDDYQGGKIGYILQPGDPGYDAMKIKALVVGTPLSSNGPWATTWNLTTNVKDTTLGAGPSNTTSLVSLMGQGDYAAYKMDTLTQGGYSDWYLPSQNELRKILNYAYTSGALGTSAWSQYWNSSELSQYQVNVLSYASYYNGVIETQSSKVAWALCLPVRSIEISLCTPTNSTSNIAACNSYTWNGQTYTSSGTYTWTGTNAGGCDSTATLKLDIVNNNDSLVVGANMFGGKIGYILQAGDPGYDATKIKGLVVGAADVTYKQWAIGTYESNWTNVTGRSLGSGAANTAALVSLMGPGNYYAYAFDTLSMGGYTDWYLPSSGELSKILPNYQSLGIAFHTFMFYTGTFGYISSTDQVDPTNQNASSIALFSFRTTGLDSMGSMAKNTIMSGVARPVRSFEITPCVPPCSPTSSSTAVAACNSYTWNGQTYTSSGTYTWTGTNAGGCDSTATLKLDIVTNNDSLVVGATMFGGKIGYILQAGDPGYDATKIKGLVVGAADLPNTFWATSNYLFASTNVTDTTLGAGPSNTAALVNLMGIPPVISSYPAYMTDTLTLGGYTDWYLPSKNELIAIFGNASRYGLAIYMPYWSSTEVNSTSVAAMVYVSGFTSGLAQQKSGGGYTRPVRSFEITPCINAPSAPTAVSIIPTSTGGVVNFTAPANDGGAAITNYEYSIDNGANWVTPSPAVTSGSLTISGLNNCTEYQVKVRAVNSAGAGAETAAVTLSTRESKQPGIDWVIRLSNQRREWKSIAYGNGLYVAVGISGSGNRVMTSPDGINWTSRTSAADNAWRSVTFGNGLFVAVASTGTGNRVMTSPDGITWTSRVSAANNYWTSVTYGNGLFVAVGATGTGNRVMTSPDGITWTAQSSAANNEWYSVTYGDGLFVAVAAYSGVGNRVMTSPDGITWTSRVSAADNEWKSVTYGNGKFVAVAVNPTQNGVMTSPDGINWTTSQSANANNWCAVTYGNGLFVALAFGGSNQDVMTSPDGINWTSRTTITGNEWSSITYVNGMFVAAASYSSGSNNIMTSTFSVSSDAPVINSVNVSADSLAVAFTQTLPALASKVTRYEYSVDNGANWTAKSAADTTSPLIISGLAKGYPYQVKLRAVNSGGTSCESAMVNFCLPASSSDTVNVCNSYSWNGQTYFESGDYSWSGTSASGCDSIANLHLVIKTTPIETNFSDRTVIGIDGGVYVKLNSLVDGGSPITDYEYSLDGGENWLPFIPFTDGSFKINGLINCSDYGIKTKFGNACGSVTPRVIRVTPRAANEPGVNWVNNSIPVKNKWVAITYGNNMYVAVSNDGTGNRVMSSPDGINWTSQTSAADNNWACIAFGNGRFVALSSDGIGNNAMYSLDGITWTSANVAANYQWRSITYGNGLFVAVAEAGAGFGGRVMTSPDGINWISRLSSDDANNWSAITYGNGLFVAVSYDGNGDRVMTSPDGINWTARKAAAPGYWYAITYGNGVFVAISPFGTGNDIMTSPDGINWTLQSNEPNMTLATISYGAGLFVAANFNGTGNDFLTSPDGINWTRSTSESYGLASITYGDGRFVGLTNEGSVLTSTFSLSADAPVIDSINVVCDSLSVSFSQTLPTLASAVTGYEYSVDNGANWTAKSAADTTSPLRIGGLAKGSSYQVKLRALNSGGTSCESNMISVVTCQPTSSTTNVNTCGSYYWNGQTYNSSGNYTWTGTNSCGCDSTVTLNLTMKYPNDTLVIGQNFQGGKIGYILKAGDPGFDSTKIKGYVIGMSDLFPSGIQWAIPPYIINSTNVVSQTLGSGASNTSTLVSLMGPGNYPAYIIDTLNMGGYSDWFLPSKNELEKIFINFRQYNLTEYNAYWTSTEMPGNNVRQISYAFGSLNNNDVPRNNWASARPVRSFVVSLSCAIAPGAPTALVATPINNGSMIKFTAPTVDQKFPITNYEYSIDNGANWVTPSPAVTESPVFVTGLTNCSNYQVLIRAVNEGGAGVSSSAINVTPRAANVPGVDWVSRTAPTNRSMSSVTYGNGRFVAVSASGGLNIVMTSPDGINWTSANSPASVSWNSVTFGNGIFVAVASTGNNRVMTSTDGLNWTLQSQAANNEWNSVTYGQGLFVAVAGTGIASNIIMTSPDGISWTSRTAPRITIWRSVTYGNGLFVAVSDNYLMTSPDGINWTQGTIPNTAFNWNSITYGNGTYVAVSTNGNNNQAMSSTDGINWTVRSTSGNLTWRSVTYGNGLFVAVNSQGAIKYIMTSPDGISWTLRNTGVNTTGWKSVTFAKGQFVAVGEDGGYNSVMTSTFSPAADAPVIDSVSINLDTAVVHFSQTKPDLATAVTNYEYSLDNGANWTAKSPAAAISPLALTGFTPGVTYPVKIRAINSAGASCESNAVSVNICQPTSSVDSVTACDNYVWHDSTYTASTNSATWVTTNARGCDSTITLVLTITPKLKWYKDNDGDGFGSPTDSTFACTQPIGYVSNNTDCNDGDNKTSPNKYWYKDKDGDGHGSKKPEDRKQSCTKPNKDNGILPIPGDYVDNDLDCNDDDSSINANTVWYKDADNDGYSNGDTLMVCDQPVGYKQLKNLIAGSGDCNDNDPTIYPGSGAPSGITSSDKDSTICKGEYVTLTANGVFPNNVTLRWYKGGCGLGASIGTGKSIRVSPDATTTYYVRVFGGPCGVSTCTSITITVKTVPGKLGAITGQSTGVCKAVGVPYTVGSVANADSYVWSVYNQAAIVSGQGTNAITVNFGTPTVFRSDAYNSEPSSVIVVKAVNSCGSNSRSLAIDTKSQLTGSISGPASLKKATTGVYSIAPAFGAKTYKWTVSAGWSIVSGNGTATVTVKAGSSTGTLKVAASNDCGDGTAISKSINATTGNEAVQNAIAQDPALSNQLRVWPVPASQVIHVDAGNLALKQVQLLDALGRTLITGSYINTLDVSKYPSGSYLVRVVTDKGVEVRKVNIVK